MLIFLGFFETKMFLSISLQIMFLVIKITFTPCRRITKNVPFVDVKTGFHGLDIQIAGSKVHFVLSWVSTQTNGVELLLS